MAPRSELKCKIEKCTRQYRAKGYCEAHYKKWRSGEYGLARYKICKSEGCRKPLLKKGYCEAHYEAWSAKRKGTTAASA